MKSMVRQFIAVTFGLCLSMLFSIFSFASTGYPWFQVPNNNTLSLRLMYHDTSGNVKGVDFSRSSNNVFYLAKPSDYAANWTPRIYVYWTGTVPGYYGFTLENSNFTIIDSEPGWNSSGVVAWASQSYYSTAKIYSLQSQYISPSARVRAGTLTIYHPNGTDGGTQLQASDFPLTCKMNGYVGAFNYAGIPDNGVYNIDTINSNKSNTAISLSASNAESLEELDLKVTNMQLDITDIGSSLISSIEWLMWNVTRIYNNYPVGQTWTDSQGRSHTYQEYVRKMYSIQNEHVVATTNSASGTFFGILFNRLDGFLELLRLQFEVWFQWFYPLKDANPQYWHVYNTDTDSTDVVNPATVTYYITWYLGQLFLMNNDNTPLGNLQDSVDDIKDQLVNVENQEQSIITSIRSGIDDFAPDLSQIGSFKALSWCSNYLQQIYVNLGVYGTVILIGLLLGVCMQFIGYFRYK